MLFKFFLFLIVLGGGGYLIFDWARTSWKKADVEQKIRDNDIDSELYDKVKSEEDQEIKEKQESIDDFLEDE